MTMIRIAVLLLASGLLNPAWADVLNIDFQSDSAEPVYTGDDGVLSTAGGATWNGVQYDATGDIALLDENGGATGAILTILQSYTDTYSDGDATNTLQDTGISGEGFVISNLNPAETYTVAVYLAFNSGFSLTDANNSVFGIVGSSHSYILPGILGQDYVLFSGKVPYDLGNGVYGLEFSGIDGLITGVQLSGALPPSTAIACDVSLDQATYSGSQVITASSVRLANPGAEHVAVEWKVWLEGNSIAPLGLINAGADGSITLAPTLDIDLGPAGLTSAGSLDAGDYAIGSRLLDPVTGAAVCEDLNAFSVQ